MSLELLKVDQASKRKKALDEIMRRQFPKEEYLSIDDQLALQKRGEVELWALLEGKTLLGLTTLRKKDEMVYLFFLALDTPYQGKGYGKETLRAIQRRYPDKAITVDFELADENAANHEQRQRRRAFYQKCGFSETGWGLSYLGVDYEIFCMNQPFRIQSFQAMLDPLPIPGFHPQYFQIEPKNA